MKLRCKHRIFPGMFRRNVIIIILLLLVWLFHKDIGRLIYPFHFREIIGNHAAIYHLDPLLIVAMIKTESNFDSGAVSPKGATGLMQLMPNTANWISQQTGRGKLSSKELMNVEININLGTWYLHNLSGEFKEDRILVLAAYNAGRGNVKNWLQAKVWTGELENIEQIPFSETRYYIRKVLWNYKAYSYLYS